MLPGYLEDWLTDEGDKIVGKASLSGSPSLSPREQLLYEVWLFDTEQRNGGISQYFCNRTLNQWRSLCDLAELLLPHFAQVASQVNQVIGGRSDPYDAVIHSDINLDAMYAASKVRLITALKAAVEHNKADAL